MSSISPEAIIDAIRQHNQGREQERLQMKYEKLETSPFVFLRGACHLFYQAMPREAALDQAPLAWACGDLHFENFGSYKGDNRQVYFDINDFDEGALAPCTWDLLRLLTSLHSGADVLGAQGAEVLRLAKACVAAYRQALGRGKAQWVERETASGLVGELLESLKARKREAFIEKRTVKKDGQRYIKVDGEKALDASKAQKEAVREFMARFAKTQDKPDFFTVLDVARRVAGTGSLGQARYVILVEGKGGAKGNYLLDLKESQASCLAPSLASLGIAQPAWDSHAQRVVTVQNYLQAVDNAFLHAVSFEGKPFVLRGLQPSEDRVSLEGGGDKLEDLVETLGHVLAWDQLRAASHQGAASADALVAFAREEHWVRPILALAGEMAEITRQQWQAYCEGAGALKEKTGRD